MRDPLRLRFACGCVLLALDSGDMAAEGLFASTDVESIRASLHERDGELINRVDVSLHAALTGSASATRSYVDSYRRLAGEFLTSACTLRRHEAAGGPGAAPAGAELWINVQRVSLLLENGSADAPFSAWATAYELGDAVSLELLSRLRELIGAEPLTPPRPPGPAQRELPEHNVRLFLRRVRGYLNEGLADAPLPRIMDAFGLSKSELGRLFGVSRQAIDGWMMSGVPTDRREKVTTVLALTDLLDRKLKAGRLPGVARTAADAYGGLTMLQMIEADRHRELLELVRDSFAWSEAA